MARKSEHLLRHEHISSRLVCQRELFGSDFQACARGLRSAGRCCLVQSVPALQHFNQRFAFQLWAAKKVIYLGLTDRNLASKTWVSCFQRQGKDIL